MPPDFRHRRSLHSRHWGVTQALGMCCEEALRISCDSWYGQSPSEFRIERGSARTRAWITWRRPDEKLLSGWRKRARTTEHAAYGVALAILEGLYGMVAVDDAEVGSGADYYIAKREASRENMEEWLLFEVAGVGRGGYKRLCRKVREKVEQVRKGRHGLPGIVCVVGFEARMILIEDVTWP